MSERFTENMPLLVMGVEIEMLPVVPPLPIWRVAPVAIVMLVIPGELAAMMSVPPSTANLWLPAN